MYSGCINATKQKKLKATEWNNPYHLKIINKYCLVTNNG